jgi:hypothetical protein
VAIDTRINVPWIPQEGLSSQILAAIQAANEEHYRNQQIALQQRAQPSEIAQREANTADLQQQAEIRRQQLDLQKRSFDIANTPIEQLSPEDQARYGAGSPAAPATETPSNGAAPGGTFPTGSLKTGNISTASQAIGPLPLGDAGTVSGALKANLSPSDFPSSADYLRAVAAQRNGNGAQAATAPATTARQDAVTPIVPNFRKVTQTGQFQFDHPDSDYKINPKWSPLRNQIEQTISDLHLQGDDATQLRTAMRMAQVNWPDPKAQGEYINTAIKNILDRRAEDGRSAKATSLPSDVPGVNVVTYTDRNGNVLHQVAEMDKTSDFTETDPNNPLNRRTYKVDSMGRPVDPKAAASTLNAELLPTVSVHTGPAVNPATGELIPNSMVTTTSQTQKVLPGQSAASVAARSTPARTVGASGAGVPGSVPNLTPAEYNKRNDSFTKDFVEPLVKLEKTNTQMQQILADTNKTGAEKVVGLFDAIGISAEPMKGNGFRVNNAVIDEHSGARSIWETIAQKANKIVGSGGPVTDQQLKDYADLITNSRVEAYTQAANQYRGQFGDNAVLRFLPRGNSKVIDPGTAQIFYNVYGQDPKEARQQAIRFGWKVQ